MSQIHAGRSRPGGDDSVKILRLLWEIVFPFEIEWRTPKQKARCRQPLKVRTTQSLNVEEVLEKVRLATRRE
jgi:hypothetical protein